MVCCFTRTLCPPQTFLHAVPLHLCHDRGNGVVLASDGWLRVCQITGDGEFITIQQQAVHGTVRALDALPAVAEGHCQQPSRVALLTDSHHISILRWDACLERLTAVQRFSLPPCCSPGLGGADAASNPYRLLAADRHGQFLAAAAALGTVAVFSLGDVASLPGADPGSQATPAAAAAGGSAISGCSGGSRVCVTGPGSEEPSLILSLAWLGGVAAEGGQQQGASVVLHQPPGAAPALSMLQWQRVAGSAPWLVSSRLFQLSDAPLRSLLASVTSRALRGLVAVPGTCDMLLLVKEREMLLLKVDTSGIKSGETQLPNGEAQQAVPPDWREQILDPSDPAPSGRPADSWRAVAGPALVTPADCSSLITCWAWDIPRDIPTPSFAGTPAAALGAQPAVEFRMDAVGGPVQQQQQQQQQFLLPAPDAPMDIGSRGEGDADLAPALAPSGMLLDPALESTAGTAAGAMQLGSIAQHAGHALQEQQGDASWHSGRSAALLFGCEDGTLWRAELTLHGRQGSWPSMRLYLCYEGDVPARVLQPMPEGRLLYCPDVRDARLLQLTRVPDTITSPRESDSLFQDALQPPRASDARLSSVLEEVLYLTLEEIEAGGGIYSGGQLGLAAHPPGPSIFWEEGGDERLLATARQWLGQMPPEQRRQFLHWFTRQGGMQVLQGLLVRQETWPQLPDFGATLLGGATLATDEEELEAPSQDMVVAQEGSGQTEMASFLLLDQLRVLFEIFSQQTQGPAQPLGLPSSQDGQAQRGRARRLLSLLRYAEVAALPSTAGVADALLADLEGLHQDQVYTVCAQGFPAAASPHNRGGVLQVHYPDPRPETVFESGELGGEAVTGMWGLRQHEGDAHHSLLVMSFVGGTRAMQLQGGVFEDITDQLSLDSSSETLACGNMHWGGPIPVTQPAARDPMPPTGAAAFAAQVTPAGVRLFVADTSHPADLHADTAAAGAAAAAAAVSERQGGVGGRGGSPIGMDISSGPGYEAGGPSPAPLGFNMVDAGEACDTGSQEQMAGGAAEGGEGLFRSHPEAAEPSPGGAGGYSWWPAPPEATLSTAAVSGGVVLAYCTGSKEVVALMLQSVESGEPALVQVASLPIGREVSCISNLTILHSMPSTAQQAATAHIAAGTAASEAPAAAAAGGWSSSGVPALDGVFAVGTYQPSVMLVRVTLESAAVTSMGRPGSSGASSAMPGRSVGAGAGGSTASSACADAMQLIMEVDPRDLVAGQILSGPCEVAINGAAGATAAARAAASQPSPASAPGTPKATPAGALRTPRAAEHDPPQQQQHPQQPATPRSPAVCASPRFASPLAAPPAEPAPGDPPEQLIPESLLLRAVSWGHANSNGAGVAASGCLLGDQGRAGSATGGGSEGPDRPCEGEWALGLAVGLRTGELLQAVVRPGSLATSSNPSAGLEGTDTAAASFPMLCSVRVETLGTMPVVLVPLPAAAHPLPAATGSSNSRSGPSAGRGSSDPRKGWGGDSCGSGPSLALCDRPCLLHPVAATGVLAPRHLALLDVVKAVPLLLPAPAAADEAGGGVSSPEPPVASLDDLEEGLSRGSGAGSPTEMCEGEPWHLSQLDAPGLTLGDPASLLQLALSGPQAQHTQQHQEKQGGHHAGRPEQARQPRPLLFLLCATADSRLKMVSLDSPAPTQLRSLPLSLQPRCLAAHRGTGLLAVAGSVLQRADSAVAGERPAELAAVQLVDPTTGTVHDSWQGFMPGECITALAAWDPSPPPPSQVSLAGQAEGLAVASGEALTSPTAPSTSAAGPAAGPGAAAAADNSGRSRQAGRAGGLVADQLRRQRDAGELVAARLRLQGLHGAAATAEARLLGGEPRPSDGGGGGRLPPRPPLLSHPIHISSDPSSPSLSPPDDRSGPPPLPACHPLGGLLVVGTSIPHSRYSSPVGQPGAGGNNRDVERGLPRGRGVLGAPGPGGEGEGEEGELRPRPAFNDEDGLYLAGRVLLLQPMREGARQWQQQRQRGQLGSNLEEEERCQQEEAPRIYLVLVGETRLPGRVTALCPYQPPAVSAATPAISSSPALAPREGRWDTHCEAGEGHAGAAASAVSGSSSGEGFTQHEGNPQPPAALSRLLVGVGRRLVSYRLDPAARAGKAGTAAAAAVHPVGEGPRSGGRGKTHGSSTSGWSEVQERYWRLAKVHWLPTLRPTRSLEVSPGGLIAAGDAAEGVTLYRYVLPAAQYAQQGGQGVPPLADGDRQQQEEEEEAAEEEEEERDRWLRRQQQHQQVGRAFAALRRAAQRRRPRQRTGPGSKGGPGAGGEGLVAVAADAEQRPLVGALALDGAAGGQEVGAVGSTDGLWPRAVTLDIAGTLALTAPKFPSLEPSLHTTARCFLGQAPAKLLRGSLEFKGASQHVQGHESSPVMTSSGGGSSSTSRGDASPEPAAQQQGQRVAVAVVVTASGAVVALGPLPGTQQRVYHAQQVQRALGRHPTTAPLSGTEHEPYRTARVEPHTGLPVGPVFRHSSDLAGAASGVLDSSLESFQEGEHGAAQQRMSLHQEGQEMGSGQTGGLRPDPSSGGMSQQLGHEERMEGGGGSGQWGAEGWAGSGRQAASLAGQDLILDGDLLEQVLGLPDAAQQELQQWL